MAFELRWSPEIPATANAVQRRWAERIRAGWLKRTHGAHVCEKYEFKRFEFSQWAGRAIVLAVTSGLKDDAGTAAEVFCREAYLVIIGPRGAISTINQSFGGKSRINRGRHVRWQVA